LAREFVRACSPDERSDIRVPLPAAPWDPACRFAHAGYRTAALRHCSYRRIDGLLAWLEAITMVQTDSNAAAAKPVAASPERAMLVFAGWGILSGIACYFAVKYLIDIKVLRLSFYPFGQHEGAAPIPPGIIFGLVIADCVRHFGVRSWLIFLLVVLVTTAAWIAAYDVTVWADMQIGKYRDAIDTLDTLSRTAEPQPGQPAPAAAQAWRRGEPLSFALRRLLGGS